MSTLFAASLPRRTAYQRRVSAEFFGSLIQGAREQRCLSVEEIAPRAGMTVAEWEAMEAGKVPGTREQLMAIAEAFEVEWIAMASLAIVCRQAWGR